MLCSLYGNDIGDKGTSALAAILKETQITNLTCAAPIVCFCVRALTQTRTLSGGGALELRDYRLFEDRSNRRGAIVSHTVVPETASKGCRGGGEMSAHVNGR